MSGFLATRLVALGQRIFMKQGYLLPTEKSPVDGSRWRAFAYNQRLLQMQAEGIGMYPEIGLTCEALRQEVELKVFTRGSIEFARTIAESSFKKPPISDFEGINRVADFTIYNARRVVELVEGGKLDQRKIEKIIPFDKFKALVKEAETDAGRKHKKPQDCRMPYLTASELYGFAKLFGMKIVYRRHAWDYFFSESQRSYVWHFPEDRFGDFGGGFADD